ncbi:MAG: protein kinase [Planctomycetota bacterium]
MPDDAAQTVADHLAQCDICVALLSHPNEPRDSLLIELRNMSRANAVPNDEGYEQQMAALEAIDAPALRLVPRQGEPLAGKQLREYRLLEVIGQGGMGTVYRAVHTRLDRVVAVKVLAGWRREEDDVRRFCREIKAVGKLHHPNIVQATDAGEIDGTHFLVMEYIEGIDLGKVVQRHGRLALSDACAVALQTATALSHAHAHGLIHRDVKPSNLMLTPEGQVKLLDLGLARSQNLFAAGEPVTQSHVIMGSADYMAPEQADDAKHAGLKADLYSLGCTLYHLTAGEPPYPTADYPTAMQKLKAHASVVAPPLRRLRPETPAALSKLVEALMSKDPAGRPENAESVMASLRSFAAAANLVTLYADAAEGGRTVVTSKPHDGVLPARLLPAPLRTRPWIIALAVSGFVALLAAAIVVQFRSAEADLTKIAIDGGGIEDRTAKSPGNSVITIDPAWLTFVMQLPVKDQSAAVARELKRRNPEFDGQLFEEVEGGAIVGLTLNTHFVADISPVRALARLKRLNCVGLHEAKKGRLRDLRPLTGLKLTQLIIAYNDLNDLGPLKNMPLIVLDCSVTSVSDLSPLKNLKSLKLFSCHGTGQVIDLEPLRGLLIKDLDIGGNRIASLEHLEGMPLELLNIDQTDVVDLTPVKRSPLRELRFNFDLDRDGPHLRAMSSLTTLNALPVHEALKKAESEP